jgi:hypothetical protein
MVRCADFYKKWEKVPNWCEKTKGAVSLINSYLDLVAELSSRGIDKDIIYAKFSETAARPVFSLKNPETRVKILNYICSCLSRSEKIQAGDLKNLVSSYEPKEKPTTTSNSDVNEFTKVNSQTPLPEEKPEEQPPVKEPGQVMAKTEHAPILTVAYCKAKVCPEMTRTQTRGDVCKKLNLPINQMGECPEDVLERRKKAAAEQEKFQGGYVPAGQPSTQTGLPHARAQGTRLSLQERDALTKEFSVKCLSDKQREILDDAVKTGEMGDCWFDVISSAVDDVGERMGGA